MRLYSYWVISSQYIKIDINLQYKALLQQVYEAVYDL